MKEVETPEARDVRGRAMIATFAETPPADLKHLADAEAQMLAIGEAEHKRFKELYWTVRAKAGVRPSVDGAMAILATEATERYGTDRAKWRKTG